MLSSGVVFLLENTAFTLENGLKSIFVFIQYVEGHTIISFNLFIYLFMFPCQSIHLNETSRQINMVILWFGLVVTHTPTLLRHP